MAGSKNSKASVLQVVGGQVTESLVGNYEVRFCFGYDSTGLPQVRSFQPFPWEDNTKKGNFLG